MGPKSKLLPLFFLFFLLAGIKDSTAYSTEESFPSSESADQQPLPAVSHVDPEAEAKQARIKELEERFRLLSQSLGGMPTPPELKNKKISFGQKEEKLLKAGKKS